MNTQGHAINWNCQKCSRKMLTLNYNLTRLFCGDGNREIHNIQCKICGWWEWY